MIGLCLKHRVTYTHTEETGAQDDYGDPTLSETSHSEERCFYDLPKRKEFLKNESNEIGVDAILYLLPDTKMAVGDKVTLVKDKYGATISNLLMRVIDIIRAADENKVHHFEARLAKI